MRVVAGNLRGRALAAPEDMSIRPTSDRVREAVFNVLLHGIGVSLEGARVMDLFAGTGALGIEALSRGAGYVLFVEEGPEARALIRTNIEAFGLMGVTRIFRRDATDLGPIGNMAPFSIAFLDPPYGQGLAERALVSLRDGGWLVSEAVLVIEERAGELRELPQGYAQIDRRSWGETEVTFARRRH